MATLNIDGPIKYLFQPAKEKSAAKSPALILLHGVGSNEQDLFNFANSLDPRFAVFSLRAPLTMGTNGFAWFHVNFAAEGPVHDQTQAEGSRLLLKRLIEEIKQNPQVDSEKVFLLGFSQGTIMSLSVALTESSLVAGVIAIAGRTLQEISALAKEKTYKEVPDVFLVHGTEDNKLPYKHALNTEAVLKAANFPLEFKSYEAGHQITPAMFTDIQNWLKIRI